MNDDLHQLLENYTSALQASLAGGKAARRRVQESKDALQRYLDSVSERLKTLQQEHDFAETLLQTAQVIVLVLDTEGRIVRCNPYLEQISGYRLAEVQGKDWFAAFLPERERPRTRDVFARAIQGTKTQGNVNSILTKNGLERHIAWFDTTLKDIDGNPIGLLAIGQDITDRKRAEAWLFGLINTTQDAVVTIDLHGNIVLFNPSAERIFGYTKAEVCGQNVGLLMPEPYASEHDGYVARHEQTGERRAIGRIRSVAARRKSGEIFPIELSVTEIDTAGEVRYGAFIRDISDKVQLQEKLLDRERLAAIGTTAAKFAHEVGNPLNSMFVAIQRLDRQLTKRRDPEDEALIAQVQVLMSEIKRLHLLLEEFRLLARRPVLSIRPLSLATIVEDVLTIVTPEYNARGIDIRLDPPSALPTIEADAERLKQVLLNLCKNATEAMPQGGTLTIRVSHGENEVTLEVHDTGAGVPPQLDIFEPFATTKTQGTGLGLTIARQIVAAHQGTLSFHSTPGHGTTFRVTLPLSQPQALHTE